MNEPADPEETQLKYELGRLVQALEASGKASLPSSADELLSSIVEAAARIFGAAAASILLVHETDGELEFKVAYGEGSRDLVGVRIPINQGIAGYVAMSGQPIAISDVDQDARFNRDFARSTGYVPRSILATPLMAGDRVLGVMEILDKINAPAFGMQDMELLGIFARQAALAIDQAQKIEKLGVALVSGLEHLAVSVGVSLSDDMLDTLQTKPEPESQADLQKLVEMLHEFSRLGELEREMALDVLSAFAQYGKRQRRLSTRSGWR